MSGPDRDGEAPAPGDAAARRALLALIVVATLVRLAWASALGPGNDEAYHALFVAHPAWSYFDHPPMLAVVEALGLSLSGGGPSVLALRLGFIALFAGSTLMMFRLAARFYGEWAGFLAAFILNATAYYGFAAGAFALPDGPLLFFWLWTLDRLAAAFESPDRLRNWALLGLAWGGALLSKYHAVLLPAGAAVYLVIEPSARRVLRRPGPYLALVVGLVCFAPVIGWNAGHGWVSFAFQGGRALGSHRFRPDTLAAAIGGQAAYYLPWIWLFLMVTLVRGVLRIIRGTADRADRFLIGQSVVPLVAFLGVASLRSVLPHWSLVGLLPVVAMLGGDWSRRFAADPSRLRRRLAILAAIPLVIALIVALHVRTGLFQTIANRGASDMAESADPTGDLYGWDLLAREMQRRGLTTGSTTNFLFTSRWYYSGQLGFALGEDVPVLCYNRRHAQEFAFWSRPEDWVGRDGLFVGINNCDPEVLDYSRYFRRVEPLGDFAVLRAGQPVRTAHFYRFIDQLRPFPFGNDRNPPVRKAANAGPTTSTADGPRKSCRRHHHAHRPDGTSTLDS